MSRKTQYSYTVKRHLWLRKLSLEQSNRDGYKMVPCQCMQLGWTEWCEDMVRERLTQSGANMLQEWTKYYGEPHDRTY